MAAVGEMSEEQIASRREKRALREEIERLKGQLARKDAAPWPAPL
jgi:uncharacterized small protein (DUF1192 family)